MFKLSSLLLLPLLFNGWYFSTPPQLFAQTENAATRDYAVALGFERKGHYPQAIERWSAFVKQHSQDKRAAMAYYHLGNCYYQHKDFPNAAKTFQHVLSAYKPFPHRDAAEFNLALVFYHQATASTKPEDYKKAATTFSEMAKHHPKSQQVAQAGWYQAECLYQANDKPQAAAVYQTVINAHGNSPLLPDLYLAMGTTQSELEQYEAAEKAFQTFLSKFGNHPHVAEVKLRMGLVKMNREQYEPAGKFFQEAAAVKDFPLADFAEVQRGQSLFQLEKYAEASAVFEGVPSKFPKSGYLADALIAAGKSRFREGKFPEAERSLKELLAKHKSSGQVSEGVLVGTDTSGIEKTSGSHQGFGPRDCFSISGRFQTGIGVCPLGSPGRFADAGETLAHVFCQLCREISQA